jgi:hypothetical protein
MAARQRTPLPVTLWNWRKELAVLGAALILALVLVSTLGLPWLIVGLSAVIGLLGPPWSEQLRGFVWQILTPHLLRSGLYQAGIQNRAGRLPVIVRITREPFGERLRLRCPPGTCAEDLWYARDILRAACRAADVHVFRDEWRAHMITVDVIRNPLGDRTSNDYPELAA